MLFRLKKTIISLLTVAGSSFASYGQPIVTRISQALTTFYQNFPQEKVFLQTDRQNYAPGETIWFEAFVTYHCAPSVISKVLYVELIDSNEFILNRETLPVLDGIAIGNIGLPEDFPAGVYRIRSYTSWMMNFTPDFYFNREIPIAERLPGNKVSFANDTTGYTMQFFPEGGNLVQGLTSIVAFKAYNTEGLALDVKGKIVDSSGKKVAEINTLHEGMGSFVLHPMPENFYKAIVDFPKGITKTLTIPTAKKRGIVLYTCSLLGEKGEDSVNYRISRGVIDKNLYQHLILCAEMEGKSSFTYIDFDTVVAGNNNNTVLTATTPLSLDSFPSGILHLTVFNDSGEPLTERILFLHRNLLQPIPRLSVAKSDFSPHAKNTFTLEVPGDYKGSYAVSVKDANLESENEYTDNISSNLLFSSNIKTGLPGPGWYFKDSKIETLRALDLVMLTNEWARFEWNKILHGDFSTIHYNAEQSLMLKGRAYWVSGKKRTPMNGGEFSLMVKAPKDSILDIMNVPLDSSGRFTLAHLNFHDTALLYVRNSNNKNGKTITVEFEKNPLDSIRFVSLSIPNGHLNPTSILALKGPLVSNRKAHEDIDVKQVKKGDTTIFKSVTVRAYKKTHTDSVLANYATGIFANPQAWAQTLDFTNDRTTQNLYGISVIDYLVGKLAGPLFSYDPGSHMYLISWRMTNGLFVPMSAAARQKINAPALFLDEQKLSEGNEGYDDAIALLMDIKMADVALVRVFQPGMMAMVSGDAPHGAIAIYLKNGSEGLLTNLRSNFDRIKKSGYTVVQEFHSTDYEDKSMHVGPDHRKTLYWNPSLKTDSLTHSANFSFFNNDFTKRFRILIEGMDNKGKLIAINKIFGD